MARARTNTTESPRAEERDGAGDAGSCAVCGARLDPEPLIRGADLLHGVAGTFTVHQCPECGAGNTRPQVADPELAPYYPPGYGPHGSEGDRLAERLQRLIARRELRVGAAGAVRERIPGRLLDVGCGNGTLGSLLISRGWRVDGIEPSETAAEQARERGLGARLGTLATVAVEQDAYDAVIFNHSLEHIGDPLEALAAAHRALRPSGIVAVSVPNFDSWARLRFGSTWFHLDLPRHRVHYGERSLRMALERSGLEPLGAWTSTSSTGLIGSLQYRSSGGLVVREGGARQTMGLLAALLLIPAARIEQALGGGRDFLHAIARRG